MATSTILYVGNDGCQRIPVMRAGSITVFESEDSVPAIRKAFADGDCFSAITFHSDLFAPSEDSVWVSRKLSAAPLVLFDNPWIECDKSGFNVVIPAAHPSRWLKKLHDAIEANREQRECARRLRQECATVLSTLRATVAESARLSRANPIDLQDLWRGEHNASKKH